MAKIQTKQDAELWNGDEYIGWKTNKSWFENHGPHEKSYALVADNRILTCSVCGLILNESDPTTEAPASLEWRPVYKLSGLGREFYKSQGIFSNG